MADPHPLRLAGPPPGFRTECTVTFGGQEKIWESDDPNATLADIRAWSAQQWHVPEEDTWLQCYGWGDANLSVHYVIGRISGPHVEVGPVGHIDATLHRRHSDGAGGEDQEEPGGKETAQAGVGGRSIARLLGKKRRGSWLEAVMAAVACSENKKDGASDGFTWKDLEDSVSRAVDRERVITAGELAASEKYIALLKCKLVGQRARIASVERRNRELARSNARLRAALAAETGAATEQEDSEMAGCGQG